MKTCIKCEIEKPLIEFHKNKHNKGGLEHTCKTCLLVQTRTQRGLAARIYRDQKRSSKHRGHLTPNYSADDLFKWLCAQPGFEKLYQVWAISGYDTLLSPSPDRLDDSRPYRFDNLRLVTWQENKVKGHRNLSKTVSQFTREGKLVKTYCSIAQATRETGINPNTISGCCRGINLTAGKYRWAYASK